MNIVWNLEENVCLSHFLFFGGAQKVINLSERLWLASLPPDCSLMMILPGELAQSSSLIINFPWLRLGSLAPPW